MDIGGKEVRESVCACNQCKSLCNERPCWGTPEELDKIIDAGYGKRLMLDYWVGTKNHEDYPDMPDIEIICPAIRDPKMIAVSKKFGSRYRMGDYEGKGAPLFPWGKCTFHTPKKGLCQMHNKGLKPVEGRSDPHNNNDTEDYDLHVEIAKTWDSDKGREVVAKWKKLVWNE